MRYVTCGLLGLILLISGCATMSAVVAATNNPIVQRTVQYGVIKYLSGDQQKASEAERIVEALIATVDRSESVLVFDLETIVIEKISWKGIDAADQFLLMSLIGDISKLLRDQVGEGTLTGEEKMKLRDMLVWILQAVKFSQK